MATQTNPVVNQPQAQEITAAEVTYFLTDVLKQTSDQFHPGKLLINGNNGDLLQRWVRENNPTAVPVVRTLIESRNYVQAVKTLVSEYTKAVRALMFDVPSRLEWEVVHPAITKRRALEAEQSGKVKPLTDEQGRTKFVAAAEKAKADASTEKAEKRSEQEAYDAISRIFFINPRSQSRDERKIADLKSELTEYIEKHKGKKTWFDIAGYVTAKIAWAYREDEKQREKWNSR